MSQDHYIPKGRISKSKLAKMYDFCPSDLSRFLNKEKLEELSPLGYKVRSKFINARVMAKIIEILGPPK